MREALDAYTGGYWKWQVTEIDVDMNKLLVANYSTKDGVTGQRDIYPREVPAARVCGELSIKCKDAVITRAGIGHEDHEDTMSSPYGAAVLNAERNAFKRAAALFGLGDDLEDYKAQRGNR